MCVLTTLDLGRSESKTHTFHLQRHFIMTQCVALLVELFRLYSSRGAHVVITSHVLAKRTRTPAFVQTIKRIISTQWKVEPRLPNSVFWYMFYSNHAGVDSSATALRRALHHQSVIKPVFPPDMSSPNGESKAEVWKEEVTGRVCVCACTNIISLEH